MSNDGPLGGMFHVAAPDPRDPITVAAEHQAALEAVQAAAAAAIQPPPLRPNAGAHRATHQPSRMLLPAAIAVAAVSLLAAGVIGWIHSGDTDDSGLVTKPPSKTSGPSATGPSATGPSPSSTASEGVSESPSPSTAPSTPSPSSAPSVSTPPVVVPVVKAPAVVLNQTAITGLAAKVAARLKADGWTVTGTANWRGKVVSTTVYYPVGMEAAAKSLAAELGVDRIRPRVAGMLTNRLTVVLTSNPFA